MAAIALRSPQYKSITAGANSVYSLCTITIGGILRYTLRKEAAPSQLVVFEIAELCRDYLNITFDGSYTAQTLTIQTQVRAYNSTGSLINGSTFNDIGYDAYGTFMEAANPVVPFRNRPNLLMSRNPRISYVQGDIYVPVGYAGVVPGIKIDESMEYYSYSSTDEAIQGTTMGVQVNIHRIDCTKYGDGHKITFVNKFGALQDLWFFLKSVNTTTKKQEQFQRNIINGTSYDVFTHTKQVFNTIANTSISLSSGYYPEWCNQWFEQLLLSEQVWLTRLDPTNLLSTQVIPVNVKNSSMIQKTSVNERLIDYTFDFDMSFDYINNIR
jgi:hypothetical protein